MKLAVVIVILTILPVLRYPNFFFPLTDTQSLEKKYAQSQYILGEGSVHKIDDDTLYAYAGSAYIRGEDPTSINFEHPPLAKYMFGLSYLMFGNAVILNLALYAVALWLCYRLALTLTHRETLGLLAIALIGTQPIFQDHVSRALLDFPQLCAILAFFVCLFSKNRKKYLWSGICLGLFSSIKYPIPVIGLLAAILVAWSFTEKALKQVFVSFTAAVGTYLLTYAVFFFHHLNPLDFLKFEWYRLHWWVSSRDLPKFLIFSTIFTGRFKGWWSANVYETAWGWSLLWPVSFIVQLLGGIFLTKKHKEALTLFLYCQILLVMYAFGSASYARYLIPLLPFWIILGVWAVAELTTKLQKTRLATNRHRGSRKKQG